MEAIRLAQLEEKKKVKKMDVKIDEEGKQVFDFEVGESGTTGVLKQEKKYEGLTAKDIDEAEELIDPEGVQAQRTNMISKKGNWREVKKAIEFSDVVVQVLDARDPEGTRCQQIEDLIKEQSKKLIFVINKVDLVTDENLKEWEKYYKGQKLLTVAFKSNEFRKKKTDDEEMDDGDGEKNTDIQEKSVKKLLEYLFKYAVKFAEKKEQDQISVAIVGFTNVGKSSLINVLRNKIVV